jgi:tRNA (Thr-GGU) A37 N-methylase
MEQAQLQFIGVLHGDITNREDAPKNFDESERVGTLEIYPKYQEGLDGIAPGQTIVVLFWLHESSRDILKVYPRGDKSKGTTRRLCHPQSSKAKPHRHFRTESTSNSR